MKVTILCCFILVLVSTVCCGPYARSYGQFQQKGKVIPGATEYLNNIAQMVKKVFFCLSKSPRARNNEAITENLLSDRLQTVLQGLLNCVSSLKENPVATQGTRQGNANKRIFKRLFRNYNN